MKVLIICSIQNAHGLIKRLKKSGKDAWYLPFIQYMPGKDLLSLQKKISNLSFGDLIFFTSKNVMLFSNTVIKLKQNIWTKNIKYYAIGRATALTVKKFFGYEVEYPSLKENSEHLMQLPSLKNIKGKTALILRGNGGRNVLSNTLKKRGATVIFCECYKRYYKYYNGVLLAKSLRNIKINTLVITSGEILKNFYFLFTHNDQKEWLLNCQLIVVSERLFYLAKSLGWKKIKVAKNANNNSLYYALKCFF